MEDFDLNEFAKMFDAALASDNPGVKKALRNFMMVTALVHAQEDGDERVMGPLETLVKKVGDLERMVYAQQNEKKYKEYAKDYYKDYYSNPTWTYSPSTSTAGGTTWKDVEYNAQDISELLKDLKFK